jgi:hypothetical protein
MQLQLRRATGGLFAAVAIASLVAVGCSGDSSTVAGPAAMSPAGTNVAGTWTGSFASGSALCSSAAVTATLEQNGTEITGQMAAPDCGVSGSFRGSLDGALVTGYFNMPGCVGGSTAGQVNGSAMSLTIDDLRKPLVTGDRIILPGGTLNLRRQG